MLECNELGNKIVPETYSLMVCWPNTIVTEGVDPSLHEARIQEFQDWMKTEFNMDALYVEEVVLGPDRTDLLFAVNMDSPGMGPFMIQRLKYGMRWLEDALEPGNNWGYTYPDRVKEYLGSKEE